MKKLLLIFIVSVLYSCSFDNKTGIWKDASSISVDNKATKSISPITPSNLASLTFLITSKSSVTIHPPSPEVIFLIPSKLKQATSPNDPINFP